MFDTLQGAARLTARLRVVSAIRIGAGRDNSTDASDLPVIRDLFGRPYIPGSSIKGVIRSHVERIVRTVAPSGWADCNPTGRSESWCVPNLDSYRGAGGPPNDQAVYEAHCPVCRLFGSPWIASKVAFADATVDPETWFDKYLVRDGVSIDRDTGTAADARKFDFEVVPGGTEFFLQVRADNASDRELGLLYLGLSALERQEIGLGGMGSRGPGLVELVRPEWNCTAFDCNSPDIVSALLGTGGTLVADSQLRKWASEAIELLRGGKHLCTA